MGDGGSGLFQRLRAGLAKTHDGFVNRVERLVLGRNRVDEELLDEIEELYLQGDVGPQTTAYFLGRLRQAIARGEVRSPEQVLTFLRARTLDLLEARAAPLRLPAAGIAVVLVVGTNGSGKTTTVAKLGWRLARQGRRVVLAAADTFRAAAAEQLEVWAERAGLEVVSQQAGSDPAAVVFDAIRAAAARGRDTVIVDTAGRLHTKANLMEEMKKIRRTAARLVPGAPHETLLVVDAATGQNAFSQTQLFHEAVELTGIALTKLDGTARGGAILGIAREFPVPVKLVGVGEKLDDLQDFDPGAFVEALYAPRAG